MDSLFKDMKTEPGLGKESTLSPSWFLPIRFIEGI